jgi:hypothetical protein
MSWFDTVNLPNTFTNNALLTPGPMDGMTVGGTASPVGMPPAPFQLPSAADVAATPGYQFAADQGVQGVLRSDIGRGFGIGGAALKDIAGYSSGLADTYYNNRVSQGLAQNANAFGQYNTLQNNAFNQWLSLAQLGNPGNPYS